MTASKMPRTVECIALPDDSDPNTTYRLLPHNPDDEYYRERTDRNIGWITEEEQAHLRTRTVGIAGCGGMGGLLAERFLRLGIGEIRIADPEVFDASNINRQFAARRDTIGKSKAFETARMLRAISDDCTLVVYPQGIAEATVDDFLSGCDIVCDEIEFWAVGARILLHRQARKAGVSVFNCNTIGFGTRLFFFTPDSATMEECLGMDYEEAKTLQKKIHEGTTTEAEVDKVMRSVLRGLVPEIPEYCDKREDIKRALHRLFHEGKASIIATNPSMATGFLADHALLLLLERRGGQRIIPPIPLAPSYLYFDAALMEARIVQREQKRK